MNSQELYHITELYYYWRRCLDNNIEGDFTAENVKELTDYIIEIDDAEVTLMFAKYFKNADIKRLEDAIIESGRADYMCEFAQNVEGANIKKIEDAIIATGFSDDI